MAETARTAGTATGGVKRRSLIAGAAALAAGLLAQEAFTPTRVAAVNDPVVGGSTATANDITTLRAASPYNVNSVILLFADASPIAGLTAVLGTAADGAIAVRGTVPNHGFGVQGEAVNGYGVHGRTTGTGGIGVGGESTSTGVGVNGSSGGDTSLNTTGFAIGVRGAVPGNGYGVYGTAGGGFGVFGTASSGIGVQGTSTGSYGVYGSSSGDHAVYGNLFTTTAGKAGVFGFGDGAGTYGVRGDGGTGGIGVYGSAAGGYGMVARAAAGDIAALYGSSVTPNVPAFYAVNYAAPNPPNSNAGFFIGQVYVSGPFIVAGGPKSAAVPHPDGTHRLLYCVESPEAWFEDFGEGTISGGKAEVKLDPDFAAVVDTSTLHVFLTPHDEHALHVPARSSSGFSVGAGPSATAAARGMKASDVNGKFTWRVVAKRKDVAAPRLAKFALPKAPPPPPTPVAEKKPAPPPVPVPVPGEKPKA